MQRIPEPELMDGPEQARAYAEADFESVNSNFVTELRQRFPELGNKAAILDLGCGPGDIPLRLARAFPAGRIVGVDGAEAMLALGRRALAGAEGAERVTLVQAELTELSAPERGFDAVVANSLLHHLHQPHTLWRAVAEQGRPGAAVYITDLMRPESPRAAQSIVDTYAADEPEQLRQDFYNSLLAAFTPGEVQAQLRAAGLPALTVAAVSDRHLQVTGHLPGRGAEP